MKFKNYSPLIFWGTQKTQTHQLFQQKYKATLRKTIECTNEVPILVNRQILYADSYTGIIKSNTEVRNAFSNIQEHVCDENKNSKYYCCLIQVKENVWFKNRKTPIEIRKLF